MNKFLLITLFVALIALPLTVVRLQNQKDQRSSATPATVLSFTPSSSLTTPIQKNLNDPLLLDVMLDPGTNQVSIVTVVIQYDPAKLSINQTNGFQPNMLAFPTTMEGPIFGIGQVAIKLSIGSDPTKAIVAPVKVGTVTFTTIDGTATGTTPVSYTSQTSAQSIGASDSAAENVIQSTTPAIIAIAGTATNPTTPPQVTPFPTIDQGTPIPTSNIPSPTPTTSSVPTAVPSVIPTGIGGPIPTIAITPVASGSAYTPGEIRRILSILFSNRVINMKNILSKISKGKQIPAGQLKRLQKEQEPIITFFTQLIQLLQQPAGQQNPAQAVTKGVNGMLTSYQSASNLLASFSQGIQGVVNEQQRQGTNTTAIQTQLDSMNAHIQKIDVLIRDSQNILSTASASATVKTSIKAVKGNMKQIRSEFTQANQDLRAIRAIVRTNKKK